MALIRTLTFLSGALFANGQRVVNSTFFQACSPDSQLIPSNFFVSIYDNGTINIGLNATSQYAGNTTLGFEILDQNSTQPLYQSGPIDPCSSVGFGIGNPGVIVNVTDEDPPRQAEIGGFCPASAGPVSIMANLTASREELPETLFTSSDEYDWVRFYMTNATTAERVGCVQASLYSSVMGANDTNATQPNDMNGTGSDGDGEDSGAGTSYMKWSFLISGLAVVALSSGL